MAGFSSGTAAATVSRWRILDAIRRRRVMAAQAQLQQQEQLQKPPPQNASSPLQESEAADLYNDSLFADASSSFSPLSSSSSDLPPPTPTAHHVLSLLLSSHQTLPSALSDSSFSPSPDDLCSLLDHLQDRPLLALQTLLWSLRHPHFSPSPLLGPRISPFLPPPKPPSVDRFLSDLHAFWMQPSSPMPPYLLDPLLSLYCHAASAFEEVLEAFESIISKGGKPGVQHFNRVLQCAVGKRHDRLDKAQSLFNRMRKQGPSPDVISYNILIYGYGEAGNSMEALHLFDEMIASGFQANESTYTSLIAALAKQSDTLDRALQLLQEMKYNGLRPTAETYAVLLQGICGKGDVEKACSLLKEMRAQSLSLDDVTVDALATSLCNASGLSEVEARRRLVDAGAMV